MAKIIKLGLLLKLERRKKQEIQLIACSMKRLVENCVSDLK